MSKVSISTAIALIACLLGPLLSAVVYVVTRDWLFSALSLTFISILSYAIARYVLIEPYQAKLLTVAAIFTTGIFSTASVALSQSSIALKAVNQLLQVYFPEFSLPEVSGSESTTLLIVIAMLVATVVAAGLVLNSRIVHLGDLRRGNALDRRELQIISLTLADYLDKLDLELRFFDFQSSAVDPKLEKLSTTSRYAITRTALQIVSRATSRDFIVVKGEPGSGKSVMLRSLARQLIAKVADGGKVPLLLNMRDLGLSVDADETELMQHLREWTRAEFRRQTGARPVAVSNDEFDKLYAEGSLIFLFDSFDENPAVALSPHHGPFIGKLSQALVELIRASGGCIGLVFSREYKSPSVGWIRHSTYVVRPFSDKDITTYVKEHCASPNPLLRAITVERSDLYAMAKSPLLLALVVDFSNSNDGRLPASEFDVFETFIRRRIVRALETLSLPNGKLDDVVSTAKALARAQSELKPPPLALLGSPELAVLREARLVKRSGRGEAFAHKRFHEYFRVRSMVDDEEASPSVLPNRIDEGRDVLNLYAQICSQAKAKRFAKQAHKNLLKSYSAFMVRDDVRDYEATILSLRFLRDAFRNRPRLLNRYKRSLADVVMSLWYAPDALQRKHAAEQIALVEPDIATSLVRQSLDDLLPLLKRVALSEARYVSSLQPWLGRCVVAYLSKQSDWNAFAQFIKGDLKSGLTNADIADKASLACDALARALIICVVFSTAIFGATHFHFLVVLMVVYAAIAIVGRAGTFSFFADVGLNKGLTGLLAANVITAALMDGVQSLVQTRDFFFWNGDWKSILLVTCSFTMLINNLLVRRRDEIDSLEAIQPLSRQVLTIDLGTISRLRSQLLGYWLPVVLLIVLLPVAVSYDAKWALSAFALFWFFGVVADLLGGSFDKLRSMVLATRDKPAVLRFTKHFTGKRSEIASALASVKSQQARENILIAADVKSTEFFDILREPSNFWPDGRRPVYEPRITSYLAVLDERWWGLG